MIYIILFLMLVPQLAVAAPGGNLDEQEPLDLDRLISEALAQNPEIEALRYRIQALEHKVKPARALPDPMIGFAMMNYPTALNPLDIGRVPMTQTQLSYSQKFFAPGTLRLRKEIAVWDVKIGSLDVEEKELLIVSLVRKAYVRLYLGVRSLEIVRNNKEILIQFVQIAKAKYEAGRGLLQDVLLAQVALSKIDVTIAAIRQYIETTKALLNVLLNRDPNGPLGNPAAITPSEPPLDFTSSMDAAIKQRPILKALSVRIERSVTATELAIKRLNPDYTLKFAYGYRWDNVDFWTAGLAFNLPIWRGSKQRENIAETEAQQRFAYSKLIARKNDVAFSIRRAMDEISRTKEQMKLYTTAVIPEAEMTLESTISGYQVDKVDFLTLLNSQKLLFDLELEYERILVEHELSVIDLDNAEGEIPDIRDAGE